MIKKLIEDYKALIAKAKNEGYNSPKEMPLDYLEGYVSLYKQIKLANYYEDRIDDIRKADLTVKKYEEKQLINEMDDVLNEKLGYHPEENSVVETNEKYTAGTENEQENINYEYYFDDEKLDRYAEITAKWLASKTEQQQKIWKLHLKATPNKTIAKKLSRDPKYVRVTIKSLTTDFNKKIPRLLLK
jgi:hypothetical protein